MLEISTYAQELANCRRASGMKGMLAGLGLQLRGHHHWGMHDVINLMRVVLALHGRRVALWKTSSI
jgi:inhibitor of KinA sporulation pathway (predicted exonuclease)